MYEIIPSVKQDLNAVKKPVTKTINEVLQGTPSKPFGFYDFLIVSTATFWYFFWTGLAVLLGRKIPTKWFQIGEGINKGKVMDMLKGKVTQEKEKKPTKSYVDTILKTPPLADAAGNPLGNKS